MAITLQFNDDYKYPKYPVNNNKTVEYENGFNIINSVDPLHYYNNYIQDYIITDSSKSTPNNLNQYYDSELKDDGINDARPEYQDIILFEGFNISTKNLPAKKKIRTIHCI